MIIAASCVAAFLFGYIVRAIGDRNAIQTRNELKSILSEYGIK